MSPYCTLTPPLSEFIHPKSLFLNKQALNSKNLEYLEKSKAETIVLQNHKNLTRNSIEQHLYISAPGGSVPVKTLVKKCPKIVENCDPVEKLSPKWNIKKY